jgi:hypothetical protein
VTGPVKETWVDGDIFRAADENAVAHQANIAQQRSVHTGTQTASTISDFNAAADARIGAASLYKPGGSDVALADGGTGASLTAPVADKLVFYDVSAASTAFLTPGTNLSITGTTLNATGGGTSTLYELQHNFTDDPTGTPTVADTGQTFTLAYNRVASALTVSGGALTTTDITTGSANTMLNTQLSATATYLEAEFNFGATGTTDTQSVVFAAWTGAIAPGVFSTGADSPCAVSFARNFVTFSVWSGGTNTVVAQYNYPIAPSGTVHQKVWIVIDKANSRAYVKCPDGYIFTVSHTSIGASTAPYVSAQIFMNAADTDRHPNIFTWNADSSSSFLSPTPQGGAAISAAQLVQINPQATAYTLHIDDMNKIVEMNSASAVNVTVPPSSSVAFPIGAIVDVMQLGAGQVTLVAGSGVTLSNAGSLLTRAQNSTLTLRKRLADTWNVSGDMA